VVQAVDYGQGVSDAWSTVATFIPKLLAFLVILFIGWLVAKAVEKILDKILERVGFDRWVERGGIKRALANSTYDASGILGRIVYYAILLFTLSVAFGVFGPNPISDYLGAVIGYLPKLFAAILILVIAAAVAAAVKGLIQNTLGGLSYGNILAGAASVLILVVGVVAALDELQIATAVVNAVLYAALAAIAGIVIVAVGGGGIRPMQQRWERALTRDDEEKPRIAEQARRAPSPRQQAEEVYARTQPGNGRAQGDGSTAADPYGSDYRDI
jgi:Conserved TM helix